MRMQSRNIFQMGKLFNLAGILSVMIFSGCTSGDNDLKSNKIYIMEKSGKNIPMIEGKEVVKILDFPKTRQAANWTCGANAVQKICAYYGEDYREMDLVKTLRATPENGTALQPIIDFFIRAKYKVEVKEMMTVEDLKSYIDKEIPVILMIQAWAKNKKMYPGWDDGHFTVCIGYTRDDFLFADPSLYDIGYIPVNKLKARWHDVDVGEKKYYQLGIAVYGKKPKFDLEKIEEIK
jgi:ABC-type bacteriocin/lantibiotic exporter with double-glycine peptidase domain